MDWEKTFDKVTRADEKNKDSLKDAARKHFRAAILQAKTRVSFSGFFPRQHRTEPDSEGAGVAQQTPPVRAEQVKDVSTLRAFLRNNTSDLPEALKNVINFASGGSTLKQRTLPQLAAKMDWVLPQHRPEPG